MLPTLRLLVLLPKHGYLHAMLLVLPPVSRDSENTLTPVLTFAPEPEYTVKKRFS